MDASMATRPRLLLIIEPIDSPDAVQFKFVSALGEALLAWFRVAITTTYIDAKAASGFRQLGLEVIGPINGRYTGARVLSRFGLRNEATLWSEAWLREAILSANSRLISQMIRGERFDYIVNVTNTCVCPSDVWWIQGPPLLVTLDSMWGEQRARPFALIMMRPMIRILDRRLTARLHRSCNAAVSSSKYVGEVYKQLGYRIVDTIYNLTDFSEFRPTSRQNGSPYVLAYIGKETEVDTLLELVDLGIRVVGFGSKLIPRALKSIEGSALDFRGRVSHDELVMLYSNAEFTVFPFSNEPLGQVPIESMACGTPVLTYDREGPSETVINEETGWLVPDRATFVRVAVKLWNGFHKDRFRRQALNRAAQLKSVEQARRLAKLIVSKSGWRDSDELRLR